MISFVLHPIHEESVFWISSLSSLMAATFYLLAFLAYVFWRTFKNLAKFGFWILALVFLALALPSHEVAVTLPLACLFYDWLFYKKRRSWLQEGLYFSPFLILLGVYAWLRTSSGAHGLSGDYSYNLSNLPFNFVGNLIAIPYLSYYGAAIVTVLTQALIFFVGMYIVKKHVKFRISFLIIPKSLLSGLIMGAILWFAISQNLLVNWDNYASFFVWQKLIGIFVLTLMAIVIYFIVLYLVKGFRIDLYV